MKKFFKWIMNENPLFVLCLGMCPSLAITTTFENGYLMGLSVMMVLLFSNVVISLIAKITDEHIRIPVYIMVIATFVAILELLINSYVEPLSKALGIYLPLIVVNCIILGRALSYASNNKVIPSIIDALKIGLGYTFALSLIGLIRELLGNNTITIMDRISALTGYMMKYEILPSNNVIPNQLFSAPAGAFLTMGLLLGIINYLRKEDEK